MSEIGIAAGFPSPAEDHPGRRISLDDMLIRNPNSTFVMRVAGHSMQDIGLCDGDYVLVDRSRRPIHKDIVVAVVDGEFTIKRLSNRAGRIKLQAANPTFPDIVPTDSSTIEIWGVVTSSIKFLVPHSAAGTSRRST
jgi:DNA polymerase V